ncbi:hypothetical protein A0J61_06448 [Choanephora cucurbitarum]|uniref:Membrane anchor Opy2 N-terminal domain-containing protein n=1 Tax=Choanephora cucurbitarum TaxID=101091 RepID=A0A1C7NDP9_9FUNG|nr:hypothetical protein A0J61_06448 [Choanephora cucurbitarum]
MIYAASNCNPPNCSASCTPSCSANEVCTMSTMTTCGVCPDSRCVSRVALGLPPIADSSSSNGSQGNNKALIGGLVGGLLGGGLIIGALIFFFVRRDKKKPSLPLAFRHGNISKRTMGSQAMQENAPSERQITSGIIPVTFIPPSATTTTTTTTTTSDTNIHSSTARNDDLEAQYHHPSSAVHNQDSDNPFSDRPVSNATSIMSTNSDYYKRSSTDSQVGHQKATVVQATQALRARPTIMRVKTVRQADKLTRSGSIKSIRPEAQQSNSSVNLATNESVLTTSTSLTSETNRESIITSATLKTPTTPSDPIIKPSTIAAKETGISQGIESPFDDKNEMSHSTSISSETMSRSNKMDSLMSAPGDGEITIFWNGS